MHNIEHYTYKENTNKKEIEAELNDYVKHETWQEGGSGIGAIRWNDYVCENYDEAAEWIKQHDKGWYDQLAVKYYEPIKLKNDKTLDLDRKIEEAYKVYDQRNMACYPKKRTSAFIGCDKCKSRLSSAYLKTNFCPVCNADLRPATTLKAIEAAKTKWENAIKNKREYIDKHAKKEIYWIVKIEYHT